MRALELKIPPVALAALLGAAMWLLSTATPSCDFHVPGRPLIALGIALLGANISILGVAAFRRADTTVNPTTPRLTSSLVTGGIYRWSRNPMYFGFLLMLTAWALWLANIPAFFLLPVFVGYMNRFQIEPEERALEAMFGTAFAAYQTKTRRWA